jgi:hypothetical protein
VLGGLACLFCAGLTALGAWDMFQHRHSLRRNYPILANIRFGLETIRPEIRQHFLESNTDGTPFDPRQALPCLSAGEGSARPSQQLRMDQSLDRCQAGEPHRLPDHGRRHRLRPYVMPLLDVQP